MRDDNYMASRRCRCLPLTCSAACPGWALAFRSDARDACEQADGGGNLTVTFRGPPGANASACSGTVQWPRLDALLLLGVGPIDVASLRLQVDTGTLGVSSRTCRHLHLVPGFANSCSVIRTLSELTQHA